MFCMYVHKVLGSIVYAQWYVMSVSNALAFTGDKYSADLQVNKVGETLFSPLFCVAASKLK